MRTARQIRRTVATALVVLGLPGCGEPAGPEGIAGTYALQTVNGRGAPFWSAYGALQAREVDGRQFVVQPLFDGICDTLQLRVDATCSHSTGTQLTEVWMDYLTFEEVNTTVDTVYDVESCTFAVVGSAVTLTFQGGNVWEGSVSGPLLTFVGEGFTRVYAR